MRNAAIILALAVAAQASAQTHPDFSGRWTSDPLPADTAAGGRQGGRGGPPLGTMGSGWGSPISIQQDAEKLTLEYAFFGRGDMQPPIKFVYKLDGSDSKNTVMMGRGIQEQVAKATWAGDKLVITTTHNFQNPANGQPMTQLVTHTLSLAAPTSLLVEVTRAGVLGGAPATTQTTYRKL